MRSAGLSLTVGYTGHRWDPAIGQYFAPFRYYNPQTARWNMRDPLGYVDGPNVYAYVTGNPAMGIDPLGLTWTVADTADDFFGGGICWPCVGNSLLNLVRLAVAAGAGAVVGAGTVLTAPVSVPVIIAGVGLAVVAGGIAGTVLSAEHTGGNNWDKHSGKRAGRPGTKNRQERNWVQRPAPKKSDNGKKSPNSGKKCK
jgi:RHS repeat-associated protein